MIFCTIILIKMEMESRKFCLHVWWHGVSALFSKHFSQKLIWDEVAEETITSLSTVDHLGYE